jgi:hypothetical protein
MNQQGSHRVIAIMIAHCPIAGSNGHVAINDEGEVPPPRFISFAWLLRTPDWRPCEHLPALCNLQ